LLLALAKFKSLFVLLKALPAGKMLLTTGSMFAMVAFEATRGGWGFALGFVLLILVHELGHGYEMRKHGVQAGWPIFIPFFGAMIAMKEAPRDRNVEAAIAYGGPYAGTLASLAVAAFGLHFHSRMFLSLAYTGFFLNLFNMTPMSPLDGGRIAQAFSRKAWIIGLVLLAGLLLTTGSAQLILILALALPRAFRKDGEESRPLEPEQRKTWAYRYFGLCAFLAIGIYFCGKLLHQS
jgi:Zn-dependent protease